MAARLPPLRKCGKCAFQCGLSADVARIWAECDVLVSTSARGTAPVADLPQMRLFGGGGGRGRGCDGGCG